MEFGRFLSDDFFDFFQLEQAEVDGHNYLVKYDQIVAATGHGLTKCSQSLGCQINVDGLAGPAFEKYGPAELLYFKGQVGAG